MKKNKYFTYDQSVCLYILALVDNNTHTFPSSRRHYYNFMKIHTFSDRLGVYNLESAKILFHNSTSSLKQLSAGRNIATLGHIILIHRQ
jgi:hypothetical protein